VSLRSQAITDARAVLETDGDAIILTAPETPGTPEIPGPPLIPAVPAIPGAIYSLTGIYNRVGVDLDADGVAVIGDKSSITVSLAAVMSAGLIDPEDLKKPGWTVVAADGLGTTFTGRIDSVMLDRTLGLATCILKKGAP
jgi:hypothetical protein